MRRFELDTKQVVSVFARGNCVKVKMQMTARKDGIFNKGLTQ